MKQYCQQQLNYLNEISQQGQKSLVSRLISHVGKYFLAVLDISPEIIEANILHYKTKC